jgi:hypothetical protein
MRLGAPAPSARASAEVLTRHQGVYSSRIRASFFGTRYIDSGIFTATTG